MCDTSVVNNVIYDTGLKMLPAHANAAYLVEYWTVSGTGNDSSTPCHTSRGSVWSNRHVCREGAAAS